MFNQVARSKFLVNGDSGDSTDIDTDCGVISARPLGNGFVRTLGHVFVRNLRDGHVGFVMAVGLRFVDDVSACIYRGCVVMNVSRSIPHRRQCQ